MKEFYNITDSLPDAFASILCDEVDNLSKDNPNFYLTKGKNHYKLHYSEHNGVSCYSFYINGKIKDNIVIKGSATIDTVKRNIRRSCKVSDSAISLFSLITDKIDKLGLFNRDLEFKFGHTSYEVKMTMNSDSTILSFFVNNKLKYKISTSDKISLEQAYAKFRSNIRAILSNQPVRDCKISDSYLSDVGEMQGYKDIKEDLEALNRVITNPEYTDLVEYYRDVHVCVESLLSKIDDSLSQSNVFISLCKCIQDIIDSDNETVQDAQSKMKESDIIKQFDSCYNILHELAYKVVLVWVTRLKQSLLDEVFYDIPYADYSSNIESMCNDIIAQCNNINADSQKCIKYLGFIPVAASSSKNYDDFSAKLEDLDIIQSFDSIKKNIKSFINI